MSEQNSKIIAIAGPTASGKSALAIHLAKSFGGEIISFDSMQIYRGMNIGTAKPTKEEQKEVPHRMIDIVEPYVNFSVADFVKEASVAVEETKKHSRIPILCGGTGLYLSSFLNGTDFGELCADDEYRKELSDFAENHGADALHALLSAKDPQAAEKIHKNNVKRVIRALEIIHLSGMTKTEWDKAATEKSRSLPCLIIGLNFRDREKLYSRIDRRVDEMMKKGLCGEVKYLYESGKLKDGSTAADAIGYKEILSYLKGESSLSEATEKIKLSTRHYAKRQITWFSRNKEINWLFPDDYPSEDGLFAAADELVKEKFLFQK